MNILITGGAGYIGSSFTRHLLKRGHCITVVDRFVTQTMPFAKHPKLIVYQGDVRDCQALEAVTQGMEAVVHLAFLSNDPEYKINSKIAESVNLDGTNNVYNAAQKSGVKRFIFASSCSIYGTCREIVTEKTLPSPMTNYARHKLLCEKIVFNKNGFMECIVVRPATVVGSSPQMRFDLLLNRMAAQAVKNRLVKAPKPYATRPVTSMDDLHKVLTKLLETDTSFQNGSCFNIASSERKVLEWAEWTAKIFDAEVEAHLDSDSVDARSYSVDCSAVQKLLSLSLNSELDNQVREVGKIALEMLPIDVLNHPNHIRLRSQGLHNFMINVPFERRL